MDGQGDPVPMEPIAPWAYLVLDAESTPPTPSNGLNADAHSRIALTSNRFIIGRNPSTNCVINNPCVSSVHAIITWVAPSSQSQRHFQQHVNGTFDPSGGKTVTIADMSTNGIHVNGKRVGKGRVSTLREGDVVSLVKAQKAEHSIYDMTFIFQFAAPPSQHQPSPFSGAPARTSASGNSAAGPVPETPYESSGAAIAAEDCKTDARTAATSSAATSAVSGVPADRNAAAGDDNHAEDDEDRTAPQHLPCSKLLEDDFQVFYDKCLGSGAFAQVYLAVPRNKTGAAAMVSSLVGKHPQVAVKIINKRRINFGQRAENNGDAGAGGGGAGPYSGLDFDEEAEQAIFEDLIDVETELAKLGPHLGGVAAGLVGGDEDGGAGAISARNVGLDTATCTPLAAPLTPETAAAKRRDVESRRQELYQRLGVYGAIPTSDAERRALPPVARYDKFRKDRVRQKREISILRAINHPNVISTLGVYETKEKLCFAMQLAEGGELFQLVKDANYLPEYVVKFAAFQVLQGISYLHSIGIVHRDLKLENLINRFRVSLPRSVVTGEIEDRADAAAARAFIAAQMDHALNMYCGGRRHEGNQQQQQQQPNVLQVMLADFGLSRILRHIDTSVMSTLCGTPLYVGPEVCSSKLRIDQSGYTAAVDLWSCGVVVFAMLTGRPPFSHAVDPVTRRRHKTKIDYSTEIDWSAPRHCRSRGIGVGSGVGSFYSPEARELVHMLLQVAPQDRATAQEALQCRWFDDIRQHLAGAQNSNPRNSEGGNGVGVKRKRDDDQQAPGRFSSA